MATDSAHILTSVAIQGGACEPRPASESMAAKLKMVTEIGGKENESKRKMDGPKVELVSLKGVHEVQDI